MVVALIAGVVHLGDPVGGENIIVTDEVDSVETSCCTSPKSHLHFAATNP